MWQVKGFETKEKAEKYKKENGGAVFSQKSVEYQLTAQIVNLDKEKYPYLVRNQV